MTTFDDIARQISVSRVLQRVFDDTEIAGQISPHHHVLRVFRSGVWGRVAACGVGGTGEMWGTCGQILDQLTFGCTRANIYLVELRLYWDDYKCIIQSIEHRLYWDDFEDKSSIS